MPHVWLSNTNLGVGFIVRGGDKIQDARHNKGTLLRYQRGARSAAAHNQALQQLRGAAGPCLPWMQCVASRD